MEAVCARTTTVQRRERYGDGCADTRADDQRYCPSVRPEDTTRRRKPKQKSDAGRHDKPDKYPRAHSGEQIELRGKGATQRM
jgi:hypothetical protein